MDLKDRPREKFGIGQVLAWLFGLAILERLLLWFAYQPVSYSDTNSYRRLAGQLLAGWDSYDGTRAPAYPAVMAVLETDQNVYLLQLITGVAITLLLVILGWWLSKDARLAFLVGLAHLLNLGQLFFEANLLTETLATFWVLLALAGVVYGMLYPARQRNPGARILLAVGVGLAASVSLLLRPLFVFLPPWAFLFILFGWNDGVNGTADVVTTNLRGKDRTVGVITSNLRRLWASMGQTWHYLLAFSIPVLVLVGSWVGFVHQKFGIWGLSTMNGYHLVQHTGVFFEYAPDEYAALRDTYLKYRDERIEKYGTQTNTIWDAIPEMSEASGLGFYDLSDMLAKISVRLILEHPFLFARNAVEGWLMFWYAPVYWSAESLRWPSLAPVIRVLIQAVRAALVVTNMAFIITSVLVLLWKKARRLWQVNLPWVFLLSTVWVTSILQTLLDHGDNPRFLVPLQSVVVLWIIWVIWKTGSSWERAKYRAHFGSAP